MEAITVVGESSEFRTSRGDDRTYESESGTLRLLLTTELEAAQVILNNLVRGNL